MSSEMKVTIEACRVNAGLTQAQLAEELGVSPGTVANWEHGKSEPSLSHLRKISEVSTIPIGSIILSRSSE